MLKAKIEASGRTQGDLENALGEALHRLRQGNTSGTDRNSDSGFHFVVEGEESPVFEEGQVLVVTEAIHDEALTLEVGTRCTVLGRTYAGDYQVELLEDGGPCITWLDERILHDYMQCVDASEGE